jgi:hypothetical protein
VIRGHVKGYFAKWNLTGKVDQVKDLAENYMAAYDAETWTRSIHHVKKHVF